MATGAPVVVTDVGACRATVDGAGVLVPKENPDAFAAALLGLIENPSRRQALGRAGVRIASKYEWRALAPRVYGEYERLLGANG